MDNLTLILTLFIIVAIKEVMKYIKKITVPRLR